MHAVRGQTYGASDLSAYLCTPGEINAALWYPMVAIVGTHAAMWTK